MEKRDINWSAFVRNAIRSRLDMEGGGNRVEAVLINEKLRRKAAGSWDSTEAIRKWRRKR